MNLPDPQVITDRIPLKLRNILSSKPATAIFELLTGKYLFFFTLIVVTLCTLDLPLKRLLQTDVLLYYMMPMKDGMFFTNNLFGIFESFIGDFEAASQIIKIMYLAMLLVITLVIMFWLRRADGPVKRMEYLMVFGVFIKIIMSTYSHESMYVDITALLMNVMIALTLMGIVSVVMHSLKLRYIPVAVIITAFSQLVESRTIMLIVPVLLFLFVFARAYAGEKAAALRALCVAMVAAAIAALAVTQVYSLNNTYDHEKFVEYVTTYGEPGKQLEFVMLSHIMGTSVLEQINHYFSFDELDKYYFTVERLLVFNTGLMMIAAYVVSMVSEIRRKARTSGSAVSVWSALKEAIGVHEHDKAPKTLFWLLMFIFVYSNMLLAETGVGFYLVMIGAGIWICKKEGIKNTLAEKIDVKQFFKLSVLFMVIKLFFRLLINNGNDFAIMHYYVSYQEYGFLPRALVGTVFQALLGYEITQTELLLVLKPLFFVMLGALVMFIAWNYRKTAEGFDKKLVFFISFAFMASPGFMIFSEYDNIYKLDMFIVFLGLICVALSIKNNHLVWLIPPVCFLAMMVHHVFTCTVFPLLFIILLYRAFINSDKHSFRNISVLFITFFVVAGTFLYFSFVYEVPAHLETESCVEIIEERAGEYLDVPEDLFECIWVDKEGTHIEKMQERINETQIINAIILLVASSPLLYMYYYALSRSAKKEKKLFAKLGYLAMGLSVLVVFPPFITDTDYGRWSTYYLMILLLVPAMLTRLQPEGKKWYADMNKPYLIKFYFIAAIALSGLKTFDTFLRALHAFLP